MGICKVLRPVAIERGSSGCRLVTKREEFETTGLTGLRTIPTVVGGVSSRSSTILTLLRGLRERSLGFVRRTVNCRGLVGRRRFARRRLTRGLNGGRSAVTGGLEVLELPGDMGVGLMRGGLARERTETLLGLPARRLVGRILSGMVGGRLAMGGARGVVGSLLRRLRDPRSSSGGRGVGKAVNVEVCLGAVGRTFSTVVNAKVRTGCGRMSGNSCVRIIMGVPGGWGNCYFTMVFFWGVAKKGIGVNGMVTMFGRGKKMKGAAAGMGLATDLKTVKGGVLMLSLSPRKGAADKCNVSGRSISKAVCSIVVSNISVGRAVLGARFRGVSVMTSSASLTKYRVRLASERDERCVLGGSVSGMESGCSCVFVSYPPSLKVLAVGDLATMSDILVPVRYRCCTLRNIDRLVNAVGLMGSELGPGLSVRKIMLDVFSKETGLSVRMMSRIGECFGKDMCAALVPEGIELTRTPDRNGPMVCCSSGYGNTMTCVRLTRRFVSLRRSVVWCKRWDSGGGW